MAGERPRYYQRKLTKQSGAGCVECAVMCETMIFGKRLWSLTATPLLPSITDAQSHVRLMSLLKERPCLSQHPLKYSKFCRQRLQCLSHLAQQDQKNMFSSNSISGRFIQKYTINVLFLFKHVASPSMSQIF